MNGLTGDFTYDDKLIVKENPRLQSPSVFGQVFTTHYFGGAASTGTAYRPLVLATYAVQKWIHGNSAVPFHVVNVLLHAATTLVLASWLLAIGFPRGPSLAASALFAVATIHVEAVTSLVGRAEVLTAFLVLAAARLWLRASEGERLARTPYVLSLLAFQAAVFVKENAVVVPGVVLLAELFRGGAPRRLAEVVRRHRLALAGLFTPIGVLFGVRFFVLGGFLFSKGAGVFDLENPLVPMKAPLRFANAAALLFRYAAKTFIPAGLAADHSAYALPLAKSLAEPRALLGIAGLLAAAAAFFLLARPKPLAAFGIAFFFGCALPTANLLFPIGTIYAERLAYLPSAGLFCLATGLFTPIAFAVPRPRRIGWQAALLGLALAAQAGLTLARNRVWRDDGALYADMIAKVPGSAKAHYNFAFTSQKKAPGTARAHLAEAVRIFPRYYDAWAMKGKLEWDAGELDQAVSSYARAVAIFSHYENGRWGHARTLEASGRFEEAARAYVAGIAEFPQSYPLAYHWARFLAERGRLLDAEKEWRRTIAVSSGASVAHLQHAYALAELGREEEARDAARRALVADRSLVDARVFLAERYAEGGRPLAAAAELVRSVRGAPKSRTAACALVEFARAHPELVTRLEPGLRLVRASFGGPRGDPYLRGASAPTAR